MEILSFLIIIGLLLSSCTKDEGQEEVVAFRDNTDPSQWQNRQHTWRMYTENHTNPTLHRHKTVQQEPVFTQHEPFQEEKELVPELEHC